MPQPCPDLHRGPPTLQEIRCLVFSNSTIHLFGGGKTLILYLVISSVVELFFLMFLKFIFREGERQGEKHHCVVASHTSLTGDLAHNPGMCPDWKSNQWPFGSLPALNPLSHSSQGALLNFLKICSILHISFSSFPNTLISSFRVNSLWLYQVFYYVSTGNLTQ